MDGVNEMGQPITVGDSGSSSSGAGNWSDWFQSTAQQFGSIALTSMFSKPQQIAQSQPAATAAPTSSSWLSGANVQTIALYVVGGLLVLFLAKRLLK